MPAPVFIGDEVTAAGYRLAGAHTLIATGDAVVTAFSGALESAELVFITSDCAADLPQDQLDEATRNADPLVLVVVNAASTTELPDLCEDVDRVLGIDL